MAVLRESGSLRVMLIAPAYWSPASEADNRGRRLSRIFARMKVAKRKFFCGLDSLSMPAQYPAALHRLGKVVLVVNEVISRSLECVGAEVQCRGVDVVQGRCARRSTKA